MDWPESLEVVVEIPKGTHRKRRADGSIDFLSPIPSPFNYGSVLGSMSNDGDPEDVIILGPTLPLGTRTRMTVRGRVLFLDADHQDDKWVVSAWPPSWDAWVSVHVFFRFYARFKRILYRFRGVRGRTAFQGLIQR